MSDSQELGGPDAARDLEPAADIFPEFEELRRQVAQRIKDNQRFLARMFDEDFAEDTEVGVIEEEPFEEL